MEQKNAANMNMKRDIYYLIESGKAIKKSVHLEKLINHTANNTTNAEIWYNGRLIWVQRPENHYQ